MNTKMKMRMLSLLLCFVMLVGLMPTTAFAWTAPTLSGNGGDAWNIQLSDEGVLTWNDMSSATYDIEVQEYATAGTVTKIQGISGTSYNLINRFEELKIENGTYYFFIKANDTDTNSVVISFRYVSPEAKLSEPQNLRWDGTVAKWDSVANATGYEVKLYSNIGYLHSSKTTTETQYDWTTIATYGRWFEVVATGDNYRNSNAAESPLYGTTAPATQISELSATVTAPVGGEHPSFTVTVPDGAHYTATVYAWYVFDDGTEMTDSDTFVAGTQYQVRIHFTANTGYEINSASYTINGTPNYTAFDTAEQRGMNFVATVPAVTTYTVSGSVTSFNDASGDVTLQLILEGLSEPAYETTVKGNTVAYSFADVAAGTYTMKVSKANHVTREYTVVVGTDDVTQDAKIHLLGDINGDGKVTTIDFGRANSHARGVAILTGYELLCVDTVKQDGLVTTADAGRVNAHARGTSLLW